MCRKLLPWLLALLAGCGPRGAAPDDDPKKPSGPVRVKTVRLAPATIRRVVEQIFGVALRIFFRRIELDGLSRVPADGPVMFVLNHPNALIDPAFLLCLSPRPVAFLAKAPLFKTPVLGAIVRAFDSIPVYRRRRPISGRTTASRSLRASCRW